LKEESVIVRFTQWQPPDGLNWDEALLAGERHVAIVERVPGLRRYVQNHVVETPDGSEPPYAGLGEAWFDDLMAAQLALRSTEWAVVIEDASTFMDFGSMVAAWAEPRVVRDL
jgi:uncharacterized protein (TIGR02118 family)